MCIEPGQDPDKDEFGRERRDTAIQKDKTCVLATAEPTPSHSEQAIERSGGGSCDTPDADVGQKRAREDGVAEADDTLKVLVQSEVDVQDGVDAKRQRIGADGGDADPKMAGSSATAEASDSMDIDREVIQSETSETVPNGGKDSMKENSTAEEAMDVQLPNVPRTSALQASPSQLAELQPIPAPKPAEGDSSAAISSSPDFSTLFVVLLGYQPAGTRNHLDTVNPSVAVDALVRLAELQVLHPIHCL